MNVQQYACPEFVDIDNDTDPDLFAGNNKGGIFYFENNDVSGIQNVSSSIPQEFKLYQNYPNPFNPRTVITYQLTVSTFVTMKVYDVLGNEVAQLVNSKQGAGSYSVIFDAGKLPSGVYFYKLEADRFSENKKMLLIK